MEDTMRAPGTDIQEQASGLFGFMEQVPSQAYWGVAMGAMLLSALLYLTGRRSAALFVGQWPPTLAILALFYKLLRPSRERPVDELRHTMREAREVVR
jgi:hypothetical protein